MPTKPNLTSDTVLELASGLNRKARYRVVVRLLRTLDSEQLEQLSQTLENTLTDAILEEEAALESYAKFLYKDINNNFYAYIQHWGEKMYWNHYIGPMRFMPGKKYKLTHKKTGEVQILEGLGLYRDGEQVYMKLKHLTPIEQEQNYLFYDPTLRFPRRPQEDCIDIAFSKKEWRIDVMEEEASDEEEEELEQEQQPTATIEESKPRKKISSDLNLPLPNPLKTPQPKKSKGLVRVKRNLIPQIKGYLEQWKMLNQMVSSTSQWKLIEHPEGFVLCNQAEEVIVEFNSVSHLLSTKSAQALHSWLKEIMLAVTNSKLITEQNKVVANQWMSRFNHAPLEDSNKLLAYLFNLK